MANNRDWLPYSRVEQLNMAGRYGQTSKGLEHTAKRQLPRTLCASFFELIGNNEN